MTERARERRREREREKEREGGREREREERERQRESGPAERISRGYREEVLRSQEKPEWRPSARACALRQWTRGSAREREKRDRREGRKRLMVKNKGAPPDTRPPSAPCPPLPPLPHFPVSPPRSCSSPPSPLLPPP